MTSRFIEPEPPFLWPESRVQSGHCGYPPPTPYGSLLRQTKELFGITADLEASGVQLLEEVAADLGCDVVRLVVAVYPACQTRCDDLQRLLHLSERTSPRLECRVLVGAGQGAPPNALAIITHDRKPFLVTGATPNLGVSAGAPWHVNFAVPADAVTLDEFRKWFGWIWTQAAPLTPATVAIPHLVPASGSQEARALWVDYELACLCDGMDQPLETVEVDPGTGEVLVKDADGCVSSPTADLSIPPLDAVAQEMAKLYERGYLVTIDKTTRIPPLAAPVKPEWMGVESLKQHGTASRELTCRIQILDEKQQRQLDSIRTSIRGLLDRLSFPLADGTRWIPALACPLLERQVDRINSKGQELFGAVLGKEPDQFVEAQRETVAADARALYREFNAEGQLPDQVVDKIVDELKRRMARLKCGQFVPSFSYAPIRFDPHQETRFASPWSQARPLLTAIAEFPRKVFSDHYFLRGIDLDEDELLDAMDVCGDAILQARHDRRVATRAKDELTMLKEILAQPVADRVKCEAILALLQGAGREAITALITTGTGEEQPASDAPPVWTTGDRSQPGLPLDS